MALWPSGGPLVVGTSERDGEPAATLPMIDAVVADPGHASPSMLIDLAELTLPICLLDGELNVAWKNPPFARLCPAVADACTFTALIHPDDRVHIDCMAQAPVDVRFIGGTGDHLWHELHLMPLTAVGGVATGAVAIDIASRRSDLQHGQALRDELGHRLRNVLAVIFAVINDSFGDARTDKRVVRLLDRLRTLEAAGSVGGDVTHDWTPIDELARHVLSRFHDLQDGRVILVGEAVHLPRRWGNVVALILHELATNAVKYGAWSGREGAASLRWHEVIEQEHRVLHVEWREYGGPLVQPPKRKGFGLSFIDRIVASDNEAQVTVRFPPTGVTCRLRLPIA